MQTIIIIAVILASAAWTAICILATARRDPYAAGHALTWRHGVAAALIAAIALVRVWLQERRRPIKQTIIALALASALLASTGCTQTLRNAYDWYRERGDQTQDPANPDAPDAINLANITWLDTNIATWPATATLTASVDNMLRLQYDKAGAWPHARQRASDGGPLVGNAWIIARIDGTWYAATFEWMRPGQTAKALKSVTGAGGHIHREPLRSWRPQSGETYGIMVSTPARTAERTINERSNISMVTWP